MAVTKTVSAADVAALLDLGLDLLGENRVQEATRKVEAVAALRPDARPRWHLIGGLQRNKARAVARWAEQVESVDSVRLADALDVAVRRTLDTGGRESSAARACSSTAWTATRSAAVCPVRTCSGWPSTSPAAPGCGWRG